MDKGYARPTARARTLRNNATDAERALWQAISARKISGTRFNRQVPIGPFICDFVARNIRLVIEVDGGQHDETVDAARTTYLESQGYRVIRFWNNDVLGNLDGVAAEIARVIASMPSPSKQSRACFEPSREREGSIFPESPCP
jgi:very-short-patch-repair endonuclease